VLCVAVSPDGSTVAAAVEGQQELQILSLAAATGELQLQQKLTFADVANPAAVVFDSQGQLWAAGGVLARETESAHVGVAGRSAGAADWPQCCGADCASRPNNCSHKLFSSAHPGHVGTALQASPAWNEVQATPYCSQSLSVQRLCAWQCADNLLCVLGFVASNTPGSGQWEVVTPTVLPDAVRASLELRVQGEEDKQQQQQEGYYFDGFKRAVYLVEEVGGVQPHAWCLVCLVFWLGMPEPHSRSP
jgi:hypothetical protein